MHIIECASVIVNKTNCWVSFTVWLYHYLPLTIITYHPLKKRLTWTTWNKPWNSQGMVHNIIAAWYPSSFMPVHISFSLHRLSNNCLFPVFFFQWAAKMRTAQQLTSESGYSGGTVRTPVSAAPAASSTVRRPPVLQVRYWSAADVDAATTFYGHTGTSTFRWPVKYLRACWVVMAEFAFR